MLSLTLAVCPAESDGSHDATGPGVVLVFRPLDQMVRVSLRQEAMEVPSQDIITRDKKNIRCCAAAVCSVARAPVRSKNLILNPTPQTWDQVEGLPAEFGKRTPNPSTPARRVEA